MKIVLIYPPHPYLSEETQQPPLGMLYIAAVLLKAGYEVEYVELASTEESEWLSIIPDGDIYGLQVSYLDLSTCNKIARQLKLYRKAKLIMGGMHPTTLPNQIDFRLWDSIVIGEGEISIIRLLNDFEHGKLKRQYSSEFIENIDEIPFPSRSLKPSQRALSFFNKKAHYFEGGFTTIITSRGCPYDCAYCGSPFMWKKKVRFRSAENVYEEIRYIIRHHGIRQFRFQDDTMTVNKRRLISLTNLLQKEDIAFLCTTRTDVIDDDILKSLVVAGCKEIGFGIESGDQKVLDTLSKGTSVAQNLAVIERAKNYGLTVRLFFMMGTPGESKNTAIKNINFIQKAQPDLVSLMIFAPFPASDIWNNPSKYNVKILSKDFDEYTITSNPRSLRQPLVAIKGLTIEQQEKNIMLVRKYLLENNLMNLG